MATAEAALASCVEGHIVQAGNPTHLEGPLYRACTSERRLWHLTEITGDPDDPRRATRISTQWAREQIEKYGRDNPVGAGQRVRPLPAVLARHADRAPTNAPRRRKRAWRAEDIAEQPRILGVDVARFGDDSSVIFPRQGLVGLPPIKVRNIDGTQGAGLVARQWEDWQADACFIDDTGGFGSSWIDNLRRLAASRSASTSPARPPTRATTTSGRRCISRRSTGSARAARCQPTPARS
jgi:hypothetical protein